MRGTCVFVFFMIFNALLGLAGLAILAVGILLVVTVKVTDITTTGEITITSSDKAFFYSLLVVGIYITTIFILGTCSKNRRPVLIAYFVMILLLIILNIILALVIKKAGEKYPDKIQNLDMSPFDICSIVFWIGAGFGFLNFLFAFIYFFLIRKENPQLYTEVKNMEYTNMSPQYQNV